MRVRTRPRRRGLSLLEMLIAGTVVAMLLIPVAVAFDATARSVRINDEFNRAAQVARIGVRRMVEEVRTAEACQVGTAEQQSQSTILDAANLSVIQPSGRVVHYLFDSAANELRLKIDDPDNPMDVVLARNVASARFSADIEPHPESGIRRTIRVVIELTLNVDGQELYLSGSAVPRREMAY